MVFLALLPQFHLWLLRGSNWNGAYVTLQGDEPLYSGYINALIDGRPRKNDPTGGRDSTPASPLPESTFSIQLLPAEVIALLAKLCGASASSAMIVLIGAAALLASISLFWMLNSVTNDGRVAFVGTIFVLCLGSLAGGHGLVGLLLKTDLSIPSLAFLRRYQPAATFPLFFIFNLLVWRSLTIQQKGKARAHTLLAGLCLGALVFSYLYLWTAAAAWVLCLALLWLYFRRSEWRRLMEIIGIVGAVTLITLIPYIYLVSHRPPTLDQHQSLGVTYRPDLFRIPEIIAAVILVLLITAIRRRKIEASSPRVIFAITFVLLPFAVFNQQILTGKTMQPYHYEAFIVNYVVLAGLVLTAALLWTPNRRVLLWIAAVSFSWGLIEVGLPSRLNTVPEALVNDQIVPVLLHLKDLSSADGTFIGLRNKGSSSTLVFSPLLAVNVLQPTWTSQGTLLNIGGLDFGSISPEQRKAFFYMHLYYSKASIESLRQALGGDPGDPSMKYYARSVIFGHDRIVPALSVNFMPIQVHEIEEEIRKYETFVQSFSREQVLRRPVTYTIVPADSGFDFSNIDRWYERDAGTRIGNYILHRLQVRGEPHAIRARPNYSDYP